jgi:hypothetical protein
LAHSVSEATFKTVRRKVGDLEMLSDIIEFEYAGDQDVGIQRLPRM